MMKIVLFEAEKTIDFEPIELPSDMDLAFDQMIETGKGYIDSDSYPSLEVRIVENQLIYFYFERSKRIVLCGLLCIEKELSAKLWKEVESIYLDQSDTLLKIGGNPTNLDLPAFEEPDSTPWLAILGSEALYTEYKPDNSPGIQLMLASLAYKLMKNNRGF